jgi:hypothetical protein
MILPMPLRGVLLVLALASAQVAAAQDKPISVVDTDPMPVMVEGGTFFLFGGQVAVSVRNRHTERVLVTLRAWVFDQRGRLKGTTSYCMGEWLDRGTRRVQSFALDVQGLVSSDEVSVGVEQVIAERKGWSILEQPADATTQARQGVMGARRRLRLEEWPNDGRPLTPCPCECQAVAVSCESHCADTGLKAFTCAPAIPDGCAASCSCK